MKNDQAKILIVDDDESVLIDLEHILEGEGYLTATAWSGQEALRLSDAGRFDLFLIDEHLGDLNSSTLVQRLRQRQPNVPLVLMCAGTTFKSMPALADGVAVCKWQHDAVKAKIRQSLAA